MIAFILHVRITSDMVFVCAHCNRYTWTNNIEIGNDNNWQIVFPQSCPKCKKLIVELVK